MKTRVVLMMGFVGVMTVFAVQSARAASITKSDTTTMNNASDWGGTAPSATTLGTFDNTIAAANIANLTLGGDVSLQGVQFNNNLNGPVTIKSGNILSLYGAGIDMSAANANVTILCSNSLVSDQVWNIGANRTNTLGFTAYTSGNGSLVKTGSGVLVCSNFYTAGDLIISNGSVFACAGGNAMNPSTKHIIVNNGGTLRNTKDSIGDNVLITVNSNGFFNLYQDNIGMIEGDGTINLDSGGNVNYNGLGGLASSTNLTFSGILTNSGGNLIINITTGNSSLTLSGTNSTYGGITYIKAGSLVARSINSVSGGTASSSLGHPITILNGTINIGNSGNTGQLTYIGTGEISDRVINLNGTTGGATLDQSGMGLFKLTSDFTSTGAGSKTLTLQGSTAGTGQVAGVILDNSVANKTSLTKAGTGTWVLSGTNTYTGPTTISGGTLTLGGSGSLAATILTNNATLAVAPGASGLTNAVGNANVTFNAGSALNMADGFTSVMTLGSTATLAPASGVSPVFTFNINSASGVNDVLAIAGAATVGAAKAILNITPLATPSSSANTYTIITAASGLNSANYTLAGTVNYTIGGSAYHLVANTNTAGSVSLSLASGYQTSGLSSCYWTGGISGSWKTNNPDSSVNFSSDAAGSYNVFALPDSASTVTLTANTASNLTTTLDQNFTIAGLVFSGTGTTNTSGTSIAPGTTGTLTINSGGITVQSGSGTNSITAPVALGAFTGQSATVFPAHRQAAFLSEEVLEIMSRFPQALDEAV